MSRAHRRRQRTRRNNPTPQSPPLPPVIEHPEITPKAAALHLLLTKLAETDRTRTGRLLAQLFEIHEQAGLSTLFAVIDYLLVQVVDGLERGSGSTQAAIDAVLEELATETPAERSDQ